MVRCESRARAACSTRVPPDADRNEKSPGLLQGVKHGLWAQNQQPRAFSNDLRHLHVNLVLDANDAVDFSAAFLAGVSLEIGRHRAAEVHDRVVHSNRDPAERWQTPNGEHRAELHLQIVVVEGHDSARAPVPGRNEWATQERHVTSLPDKGKSRTESGPAAKRQGNAGGRTRIPREFPQALLEASVTADGGSGVLAQKSCSGLRVGGAIHTTVPQPRNRSRPGHPAREPHAPAIAAV